MRSLRRVLADAQTSCFGRAGVAIIRRADEVGDGGYRAGLPTMRRHVPITLLALACWTASTASTFALVIDDFTAGAATVVGPATVDQIDLDPASVLGGQRRISVERINSTLELGGPPGLAFHSTDLGYFNIEYGAATPLPGIDLAAEGHDRFLLRVGEINGGSHFLTINVSSPGSATLVGRSVFLEDSWDGLLLEARFASFNNVVASVDKITLDFIRNPAGTGFAIRSFETIQRGPAGDFNYDGAVDALDLADWARAYHVITSTSGSPPFVASVDADENGRVDGNDFLAWQRGLTPPLNSATASTLVPEPASLALVASFTWSVVSPRRRRRPPPS
jgi:hypothetical protein